MAGWAFDKINEEAHHKLLGGLLVACGMAQLAVYYAVSAQAVMWCFLMTGMASMALNALCQTLMTSVRTGDTDAGW